MAVSPARIRAVFFDIGNVIVRFDPKLVARKIAWALRRHPVKVARYLWSRAAIEAIERGEMTPAQLFELFRAEFGYAGDYRAFRKLWCDHFALIRPNAALLKRVALTHKVYLLSNTNDLHYEYLRKRYAFAGQVHGAVLSYELRMRKPEPRIYAAAVKLAGTPARECLFIDDNRENVDAARAFGMQVIHHAPGHDLKAALAALGLLG